MRQQTFLINFSAAVDARSLRGSHMLPLLLPRWTVRRRERPCRPTAPSQRPCLERLTWLSSPPTDCCTVTAQSALPWRKPLSLVEVSSLCEEACVYKRMHFDLPKQWKQTEIIYILTQSCFLWLQVWRIPTCSCRDQSWLIVIPLGLIVDNELPGEERRLSHTSCPLFPRLFNKSHCLQSFHRPRGSVGHLTQGGIWWLSRYHNWWVFFFF